MALKSCSRDIVTAGIPVFNAIRIRFGIGTHEIISGPTNRELFARLVAHNELRLAVTIIGNEMANASLSPEFHRQLAQCLSRCDEAIEKYGEHLSNLKQRKEREVSCSGAGLEWLEHMINADVQAFHRCVSTCWLEMNGHAIFKDAPPPPNSDDSIEHKAHCVRQLQAWAKSRLHPDIRVADESR